ncbi:MAG: tetratricopeptide repeat protein [Candidatus Obscuribacterales bacterium]
MRLHDTLSPSTAFARLIVCVKFAVIAGLILSLPYVSFLLSYGSGPHSFAREDVGLNQIFSLMLNCFIVALNPWLYVLFQAWTLVTHWPSRGGIPCNLLSSFEAVAPFVAYCFSAASKGRMDLEPYFQLNSSSRKKIMLAALLVIALMPFGQQILNAPASMLDSFRLLNLSMKYDRNKNSWDGGFTGRLLVMKLVEMSRPQSAFEKLNEMVRREFASQSVSFEEIGDDYRTVLKIDSSNKLTSDQFVALCRPLDDMLVASLAKMRARNDLSLHDVRYPFFIAGSLAQAYKLHGANDRALFWRQEGILADRFLSGGEHCRGLLQLAEEDLSCGLGGSAKQAVNLAVALEERAGKEPSGGLHYYLPDNRVWGTSNTFVAPTVYAAARDLHRRASLSAQSGEYSEAVHYLEQALKLEQEFLTIEPALAVYENQIADFYVQVKDFRAAEAHYKRALSIDEQIVRQKVDVRLAKYHEQITAADISRDLRKLANLNRLEKNYSAAELLLLRAAKIVKVALGKDCFENKEIVSDLVAVKKAQGHWAALEEMFNRDLAVALADAHGDQLDDRVTISRNQLARLYLERKDFALAEDLNKHTLALFEKKYGVTSYELEHCLDNLGDTYLEQAKFDLAEAQYTRAIRLSHGMFLSGIPFAHRLDKYTELNRRRHRWKEAESSCREALKIRERYVSGNEAELANNRRQYRELLAEIKANSNAMVETPFIRTPIAVP